MSVIVYLVVLILSGLVVGGLGRLALPGKDPMTLPQTAALGIAASLIGGLLMLAITGGRNGGGLLVAVACAAAIVYVIRRRRGGSITDPGLGGKPSA